MTNKNDYGKYPVRSYTKHETPNLGSNPINLLRLQYLLCNQAQIQSV